MDGHYLAELVSHDTIVASISFPIFLFYFPSNACHLSARILIYVPNRFAQWETLRELKDRWQSKQSKFVHRTLVTCRHTTISLLRVHRGHSHEFSIDVISREIYLICRWQRYT